MGTAPAALARRPGVGLSIAAAGTATLPALPALTANLAPEFAPVRRVVGPADVAALAVHIMTNTALTGATYDIDGGQQLVTGG